MTAPGEPTPKYIIRPGGRRGRRTLHDLWEFRDLLWVLGKRDVVLRYRQTALGVSWVLLQSLLGAGVLTLVFGRIARLPSDGVPYFLYAYAGFMAWNVFQATLTRAGGSMLQNSQLITKVFFPRLVLPLSSALSALLDFVVSLAVMLILLLATHMRVPTAIVLLPLWLALVLALALGLGFLTAAIMVRYRDVQHILPVAVQFLMYASPVAYSVAVVPERFRQVFLLNPLAGLCEAFRWSLLGTLRPSAGLIGYAAVMSVAVLFVGASAFNRMERRFSDVI